MFLYLKYIKPIQSELFYNAFSPRGGGAPRPPPRVFLRQHNYRSQKSRKVSCAQNINYDKIINSRSLRAVGPLFRAQDWFFELGGLRGPPRPE